MCRHALRPGRNLLSFLLLTLLGGSLACTSSAQGGPGGILEAATAGDVERITALLEGDPTRIHETDPDGRTPLHLAAMGGHEGAARLLVDRGSDLAALDAQGRTPLHQAAEMGSGVLVDLLVDAGSEVEARDLWGRTPLFLAANWGNDLEAVERLIAAGANVDDRTPRGEQILMATLAYGRPEIVQALMDAGARLPDNAEELGAAVYLSAGNGLEGVFSSATRAAEDMGILWWERVSMQAAARGGSVRIGESLLARGAPVDRTNEYGVTPLHVSAEEGNLAFVDFLIRSGASLEARSAMGKTALHMARERGHDEVVARLLSLGASDAAPAFPELRGPWLGQPEPRESPERFAPGIVSGHAMAAEHSPAAFSPSGTEVYWTERFRGPVLHSDLEENGWTPPAPAPFVSSYGEGEPIFSPDGDRLYFLSMRPLPGGGEAGREKIWFVERGGDGWSEPRPVGEAVNAFEHHWLFSVDREGTLYFSSLAEGGYGNRDLYRSRMVDGVHQAPENLGPGLNTPGLEHTPFIAPDGSYLIFVTSGHGLQEGMFHMVISYRDPSGEWSPPLPLDSITAPVRDPLCPLVSPDGRFLFFIGSGDIWWTRADFIEALRPITPP